MMKERIEQRLDELENEHGFRIVYACESGSRAWGFASADSDYDVRFIYVWPRNHYLGMDSPADSFDLGVDADLIDLSGWDLRKALRLFGKSNGAIVEWLHSPIIYREDSAFVGSWRGLTKKVFCPKANASHYGGLAKSIWRRMEEGGEVTAKKYLYTLRAVFAARMVLNDRSPAAVRFGELLDRAFVEPDLRSEINALVSEKVGGAESDEVGRIPLLDKFIGSEIEQIAVEVEALTESPSAEKTLSELFRGGLIEA